MMLIGIKSISRYSLKSSFSLSCNEREKGNIGAKVFLCCHSKAMELAPL